MESNQTSVGDMTVIGIHNIGSSSFESNTYWFAQNQVLETSALLTLMRPFSVFALSFHISMIDGETIVLNHGNLHNEFSGFGSIRHYKLERFLSTLETFLLQVHTSSFVFVEINLDEPTPLMQDQVYDILSRSVFITQNLAYSHDEFVNMDNGKWPSLYELVDVRSKRVSFLTFGLGPHTQHLMPKLWQQQHYNMTIESEDRTWAGHGIGWVTAKWFLSHHINSFIQGPLSQTDNTTRTGPHLVLLDQLSSSIDVRLLRKEMPMSVSHDLSVLGGLFYLGDTLNNNVLQWLVSFVLCGYVGMMMFDHYRPCFLLSALGCYGFILLFPPSAYLVSIWMISIGCFRFSCNSNKITNATERSSCRGLDTIFEFHLPFVSPNHPSMTRWNLFWLECFVYYVTFVLIILRLSTFAKLVIPFSLTLYSLFILFLFQFRCWLWMCHQSHGMVQIHSYLITIAQSSIVLYCWWSIHLVEIALVGVVLSFLLFFIELMMLAILLRIKKRDHPRVIALENQTPVVGGTIEMAAASAVQQQRQHPSSRVSDEQLTQHLLEERLHSSMDHV